MIEAGYVLSRNDNSINNEEFYFDRSINSRGVDTVGVGHNINRVELKTFGRVPYVYYAGETDFVKFNLSTVFHYDEKTGDTARDKVNRFKAMINERQVIRVKNSQGQEFLCDVYIVNENSPKLYVDEDFDYIEIEIECTEIDY